MPLEIKANLTYKIAEYAIRSFIKMNRDKFFNIIFLVKMEDYAKKYEIARLHDDAAMASFFQELPDDNKTTVIYIFEHIMRH